MAIHQVPFGSKINWLAARSVTAEDFAKALGLTTLREMNWPDGTNAAWTQRGIFACPPVDGWTLAVGGPLLILDFGLEDLSQRLQTEVQHFGSHRVVDFCAWARAENGVLLRDFEYVGDSGEIVKNEGEITEIEEDTDGAFDAAGMPPGPVVYDYDDDDVVMPTERTVLEIAAGWSVDPSTLDAPDDRVGIFGLRTQSAA